MHRKAAVSRVCPVVFRSESMLIVDLGEWIKWIFFFSLLCFTPRTARAVELTRTLCRLMPGPVSRNVGGGSLN